MMLLMLMMLRRFIPGDLSDDGVHLDGAEDDDDVDDDLIVMRMDNRRGYVRSGVNTTFSYNDGKQLILTPTKKLDCNKMADA
jgi:hypothetical protein